MEYFSPKGKGEYECDEGYTTSGKAGGDTTFSVECQSNGKLTDPRTCEPVLCGTAPVVPKATALLSGDVYYGMKLEYQCDTGYTLNQKVDGKKMFERKCNCVALLEIYNLIWSRGFYENSKSDI